MGFVKNIVEGFRWLFQVIGMATVRFYWDDCFSRASSLAYTTLFALVPVSALSFSMLSAFRIDQDQLAKTVSGILAQVLPPMENDLLKELREQILQYLNLFNQNVSALNTLSIAVLFLTAVAMLNTIESAMNVVWRASSNLTIAGKVISFWFVITGGPLLIAVSFYWWAKVSAVAQSDPWFESNVFKFIDFLVPVVFTFFALTMLFYLLPAAVVRLSDAMFGALFASVIFEVVKRGFARYISLSTTYSTIYGVLTSIPVFLFWLYCAWVVVLFGAEVSYQAGNIRLFQGLRKYKSDLGELGAVFGIRILYYITHNFMLGNKPPSESEIAIETGADPARVKSCLDVLTQANILTRADDKTHSRALAVSPERLTIENVIDIFRLEEFRRGDGKQKNPNVAAPDREPSNPDGFFLETIRKASTSADRERPFEQWTLMELVKASAN